MPTVFDSCRGIAAAEVARAAGLALRKRGGREWACCPLHGEKTASLMFDAAGRYHCFGCGAGGDGIDFARRLYRLDSAKAAAERLARMFKVSFDPARKYAPTPPPREALLKDKVDAWYRDAWGAACAERLRALDAKRSLEEKGLDRNACWDSPEWGQALRDLSRAETMLAFLEAATPTDKYRMMLSVS